MAITLDQQSERFRQFARHNAHLDYTVFAAIRGADISHAERIATGLVTEECLAKHKVTDGSIGCAASHRDVWKMAAETDTGYVVLEDDIITHPGIAKFASALARHAQRIEWAAFAVNTDSVLVAQSPQGYVQTMSFQQKHPPPERIAAFLKRTKISDVKMWRLLRAFGCPAYYVSPAGARKLLTSVFPMRSDTVRVPRLGEVPGFSIDRRLNAVFETTHAGVTLPFLAWTPNTDSTTSD